jgi:hypothetical protein
MDELNSDSRQVTPVFIPGVQDHYTGLIDAPKKTGKLPDVGTEHLDVSRAPPLVATLKEDESFKNDVKKLDETSKDDLKKLDETANHDVKKLESLIMLFLHTAKVGDDASKRDAEASTPHETTSVTQEVSETTTFEPPVAKEECAPPPPVFSCGSVGHPHSCAEPCKYARKKRGCKDGLACSRCHLCTWYHKRNFKLNETQENDVNAASLVEPEAALVLVSA